MNDLETISNLIKHQFPAFYREQGPAFIEFVEGYFQWLEAEGNLIRTTRALPDYTDIDRTLDTYLKYFKTKYMSQLPAELVGNQRLFQKHILELYRAKGSPAGLKLLFRLLYNEDVDYYVPSYDIFKSSDAIWKQPQYMEISYTELFSNFDRKVITGQNSGATAIVESAETKFIDGHPIYLLFLSNISGSFQVGEVIRYPDGELIKMPYILGSPTSVVVHGSKPNINVGTVLADTSTNYAKPVKTAVSATYTIPGIIEFELLDGGDYYSLDAEVVITSGTNTTGSGADFIVTAIANTHPFLYTTDLIAPLANVALDSVAYGMSNGAANASTVIAESFDVLSVNVGTITEILTTNPGVNYDGTVTVQIVDPYTATEGIIMEDGSIGGLNANVAGDSVFGDGVVESVRVIDSGYGYSHLNPTITFYDANNALNTMVGTVQLGAVGFGEGYFDDTKGFASSDKYLFDGHYYQDFSYAVKASRTLDQFASVLRATVHAAGNALYGIFTTYEVIDVAVAEQQATVTQSEIVTIEDQLDPDENNQLVFDFLINKYAMQQTISAETLLGDEEGVAFDFSEFDAPTYASTD